MIKDAMAAGAGGPATAGAGAFCAACGVKLARRRALLPRLRSEARLIASGLSAAC